MPYIVDGNNVIGHASGWEIGASSSRLRLLDELAAFVASTGNHVTVVFDGAPEECIPDGTWHRGILVRYAKRGSNADRIVVGLVGDSTDRRRLTVVSSDRQLASECKSRGAKTLGSDEFRRFVARRHPRSRPADPGAADRPAEIVVDEWIEYFGLKPEPEDAPERDRMSTTRSLPHSKGKKAAQRRRRR